jgi:N-acyl-D-amino-acid deacylase
MADAKRLLVAIAALPVVLLIAAGQVRAQQESTAPLIEAIKSSDAASVQKLLKQGGDFKSKDNYGNSALMLATLYSTPEIMSILLDHGADPNEKNKAGATALMWAVGDLDKVKLLVNRGAKVNAQADVNQPGYTSLMMAANGPASAAVVRFLLEHGGDVNLTTKNGFTPLMAAMGGGDAETIHLILDKKPNVRAATNSGWTAIHGAAWLGKPAIVRQLLDMGAEAQPKKSFQNWTPLIWAAMSGDPTVVQLLLDHGADTKAREALSGTSALIKSAGIEGQSMDVAKLLVKRGADINAKDDTGSTALVWAERQGSLALTNWLRGQGAEISENSKQQKTSEPAIAGNTVDQAVRRAIPLLEKAGPSFMANSEEHCASCHHQSLPAMALSLARLRGFPVSEKGLRNQAEETRQILESKRELLLQGMGLPDRLDPGYLLAGLSAAKLAPDFTTDALVHFMKLKQFPDGRWTPTFYRPPMDGSDFTATALSLRALQTYGPKNQETKNRIERAKNWLVHAEPKNTEDATFQLLGMGWAKVSKELRDRAKDRLLALERADGGWGQLPGLPSDDYATGQVLVALHQGGGLAPTHEPYQRGVRFLLRSQRPDGSWFVSSRSLPVQPYFESGFPHGRSQFISCAGTCWATMALALTVPEV